MVRVTRREALLISLAAAVTEARAAAKGPPLWIAERGRQKAFLFGQMPVRPESTWFSPTIQQAFDSSTELWVENPEFDPAEIKAVLSKRPAGPTLKEAASAAQLQRLHAVLVRAGKPADAFDGVPLAAAYSAMTSISEPASGPDAKVIPEAMLKARAKAAAKPVHSEWKSFAEIERFQSDMPDAQRRRVQLELFGKELDAAEDPKGVERMLTQWLVGTLDALDAKDRQLRERYAAIYGHVGADRNKAWVPRIESALVREQIPFVCVGILHVIGPESILAHLARSGFSIRRA